MLYTEFKVGEQEFKLRIDARATVALEKKLGRSPLDVFMDAQNGSLPKLEGVIAILHASLQKYQNGFTEEKVYDLYDKYIEEGGTFIELISVLLDVFKTSGFFKDEEVAEKN